MSRPLSSAVGRKYFQPPISSGMRRRQHRERDTQRIGRRRRPARRLRAVRRPMNPRDDETKIYE